MGAIAHIILYMEDIVQRIVSGTIVVFDYPENS